MQHTWLFVVRETESRIRTIKHLDDIRQVLRDQKVFLEEEYGVKGMGIFGSCVREEQNRDNDVDMSKEVRRTFSYRWFGPPKF